MIVKARFKSLFILPAVITSAILCVLAAALALRGENDSLAWWGASVSALPLPLLLARLAILKPPRTAENEPLALLVSAAGTFMSAWEYLFEGASGPAPLVAAATAAALLLLYVFWYSRFGRIASGKLDVGGKLPGFSLHDAQGDAVHSRDLRGRPAILIFYRGNWCPLCVAQVGEMAGRYRELDEMGVSVVLISPQPQVETQKLAASHATGLRFWVDSGNRVARELDIAVHGGVPFGVPGDYDSRTVMPTVVVTNDNGRILYSDQTDNYRVRPEPDTFIAILRRAGAIA